MSPESKPRRSAEPPSGEAVLGQLLPAFEGTRAPAWLLERIAAGHAHGVTVFLRANAAFCRLIGYDPVISTERAPDMTNERSTFS